MLTVTTLKEKLQAQIAPSDDVEFLRLLQEADDRLTEFGKWQWTRNRLTLTVENGLVTLPPAYAGILGVQVRRSAKVIEQEVWEFAPGGAGDVERNSGDIRLIDNGYADVTDGQTTETRRVYKVAGEVDEGEEIVVLAHYASALLYDPDIAQDIADIPANGTDTPHCPDLGALKLTMLAIIQEEAGNPGLSAHYMALAHRGLDNKEKTIRGGARQTVNEQLTGGPTIRKFKHFR